MNYDYCFGLKTVCDKCVKRVNIIDPKENLLMVNANGNLVGEVVYTWLKLLYGEWMNRQINNVTNIGAN